MMTEHKPLTRWTYFSVSRSFTVNQQKQSWLKRLKQRQKFITVFLGYSVYGSEWSSPRPSVFSLLSFMLMANDAPSGIYKKQVRGHWGDAHRGLGVTPPACHGRANAGSIWAWMCLSMGSMLALCELASFISTYSALIWGGNLLNSVYWTKYGQLVLHLSQESWQLMALSN